MDTLATLTLAAALSGTSPVLPANPATVSCQSSNPGSVMTVRVMEGSTVIGTLTQKTVDQGKLYSTQGDMRVFTTHCEREVEEALGQEEGSHILGIIKRLLGI
jgi:hypothetical protein